MGKPKCLNCFLKRRVFFDFYSENDNKMCGFQMSSTSALTNIRFEIFFHQISFLFEILSFAKYIFSIQIRKAGVPVRSLLGVPDLSKTQVVQDPETGESRAKMTEVEVDCAQI